MTTDATPTPTPTGVGVASHAPVVTAADVRAYLRLPDTTDDPWLDDAAAAATAYVQQLPHLQVNGGPPPGWNDDTRTGATMLAGRIYSSRNAPLGAAGFDAMGGLVTARTDPEVSRLLRIGRYLPPGIA